MHGKKFLGARLYGTGYMASAQYTTISSQVNIAHNPTMVSNINVSCF